MPVDLTDPRLRILECSACAEPVSAIPDTTLFVATCAACGAETRRELRPEAGSAFGHGYRSAPVTQERPDVPFTRPVGTPRFFDRKKWRVLIPATRQDLATASDPAKSALAHRLFWFQMTLTGGYLQRGNVLRARATLESAFEDHELPLYRGVILTRLARISSMAGGAELAKAWLARLPPELEPDLAEEVWLTRMMIARTTADPKDAATQLDGRTFGAHSHSLGTALHVDALERSGDLRGAYRVYRVGTRGRARLVNAAFRMYRLAPTTYAHAVAVGKSVVIVAVVGILYAVLELMGRPNAFIALALFLLLALALAVRVLRGPRP